MQAAAGSAPHPADQPITALRGVGPALAGKLERLGIVRVGDLLTHLPRHYQDRTRSVPIADLRPGLQAVVTGEVRHAETVLRRRRSLLVALDDGTGRLTLRFFHFSRAQQQAMARGRPLRVFGEVRSGAGGALEMVHPEITYRSDEAAGGAGASRLTPIYPATEGVAPARLRGLIEQALAVIATHPLPDPLADDPALAALAAREEGLAELPGLNDALVQLHRPHLGADLEALQQGRHPAQRRLALEELLAHQLSVRRLRVHLREEPAPAFPVRGELLERFLGELPFALTAAQRRVIDEIREDLSRPQAMLRLVQGDVGSGKTLVALAAALFAIEAGYQAALMVPTELLAEQHAGSFAQWLRPLALLPVRLTGRLRAAERRSALEVVANGEAHVVIGTHALFQETVRFARLGLVIVDEQHRFGVHQRLALREKGREGDGGGSVPHQLVMTATPIPRTLAMSAYADLDTSVIDELPPGRSPVRTVALPTSRRPEIVARIREQCRQGAQAYWVCPLIEESEALNVSAAQARAEDLAGALAELRVLLVHGRMSAAERSEVMGRFKAGDGDILVATTVIEVGVDVPNASLMIIENAERLGLAQLHQLRGRVGRGTAVSSCVLLYEPPLGELARERLGILRESNDGFVIAEKDLALRGPGEVLGTRQTGLANLRVADLARDGDLIPLARRLAEVWLSDAGPPPGAASRTPAGAAGAGPGMEAGSPDTAGAGAPAGAGEPAVDLLIGRWIGEGARYGTV